jgi:endonuclease/exonuclease/phosphatase family metal-dependent hydrolase
MPLALLLKNRSVASRSVFSFPRFAISAAFGLLVGITGICGIYPTAAQEPARSDAPVAPFAKKEQGEIIFVAYNLWNYLAMDRRIDGETVEDAPKPEDQVTALIDAIAASQPDILGVCEIGDETFLKDLQKRLKSKGIDLPHTEMIEDDWEGSRNLALLSRFPIVERNSRDDLNYRLDDTVQPFQRGILDVTVAPTSDYRLRCVGLHLKSKREVRQADQAAMRRNEAQLAREHIDAILADQPGVNLITYGDFNDTRNEAPVRTLQGRFGTDGWLDDLKLEDQYGFRWTHYWNWADIYARIDFALVSPGLSPEIDRDRSYILHFKDWALASDHRPLVVSLKPEDQ